MFLYFLVVLGIIVVLNHAVEETWRDRKLRKKLYAKDDRHLELGAIFMLVSDWKSDRGRKCGFNSSITSLSTKWFPNNHYPIILMGTKPWKRDDMVTIKRRWSDLDFKFINIEKEFNSQPTISEREFEDHEKPLSNINYKRMCHFFFCGFMEVPSLMEYKFLMRLDDDTCLLDNINYDLFKLMERKNKAYAFSSLWYDPDFVTRGLLTFVHTYMNESHLKFKNPTLHDKVFPMSATHVGAMNTNLEIINTMRFRDKLVQNFVEKVVKSNYIFHRRWGDAPLRSIIVMIAWTEQEIMRLDGFEFRHSSWDPFRLPEVKASTPELYVAFR